jgi:CCR4-NOT transcription complex subunit 1
MSDQDMNQVLSFCQSVFKRLYEINVGIEGMLRLEALVSLLKQVQESGVNLLRSNLNNWITFAPVDTAVQVKGHRRILMLLLREKLIGKSAVDGYLARNLTINNSGNDQQSDKWLDFAGWFVKTATVERICTASDFPNTMDYLQHFVKSQDSVSSGSNIGLVQAVKRLLDEFQLTSQDAILNKMAVPPSVPSKPIASTLSSDLAGATFKAFEATLAIAKNDPPGMRSQVMFLLDSWLRVYDETSGNEKTVPVIQFLQLLQQHGVGKSEEQTERFFRFSTELVVEASIKSVLKDGTGSKLMGSLNYNVLDAYAKLVILLVQYMNTGGSSEKVAIQRVNLLNKVLGITVRTLMTNYEYTKQQAGQHWDQRPWFRLLLNLIQDLGAPSAIMDPIRPSILSVFGSALHVIQPCVVPGYSFAWLQLISHRMFLSNLMLLPNSKGWALAHQLLIDLFIFLEPHLRSADMNDAIKHLYNGTLRVLLVLVHDFPSFLAGYHLSFCNVIPENCVQLRNLILSASPKGMVMPDPFTPNLKIDHLPEIGRSPSIKSNVIGPILSLQSDLDNYLTTRQSSNFLQSLLPRLLKDGTDEIDIPRVNSLVLYVGMQAIARLQSGFQHLQIAQTPEMEVLQKLMDFDERSRYIALNAIANQLRYPSTHSHYFSCVMLFLFSETDDEGVKEQVTRVLLERLISHRPHPWALIITFVELLKNQRYQFWSYSFTRCATEIEKVFESVARSCMSPSSQPQSHRMVSAVGGESEDL